MQSKAIRTVHQAAYTAVLCLGLSLAHTAVLAAADAPPPGVDVFSTNGEWHELSPDRFSTNGEYHEQTGGVVAASAAEPYLDQGSSDLNTILAPTAAGITAVTDDVEDMANEAMPE